ncbi:hydantoinase/oxoprolinase N-terminal domain-containing protein [Brucella pituitosa]|uniref:hydantoinase/oxoprolinase N-terminal domain-containing protein n=1 Tax=Brucella pituitosa TaxID=571256 RepID=UPI002092F8E6|nr:hydantoinase/oxoprolinase N-terminal domain-containing protein [Brucella pituitosa]
MILSLGCESVINVPVIIDGEVVGTLNCLHDRDYYTEDRIRAADALKLPGAVCMLLHDRQKREKKPMSQKTIRVATDVGGTFTDLVCFETDHATGQFRITTAKSDTTPPNFEQGVLNVLDKGDVDPKTVDFLAHGTTVVINALTERKGVKVGLITTEGFRDSLEIARGNRPDFFNLNYEKPEPFVPRYLRRELSGRFDYHGTEMKSLDLSGLPAILDDFRAEDVEAIAVCFLHSYANPSHEQATIAEIARLWPEIATVASHQITREWREYERTNTTVMSAYVQPTAERYLSRLNDGLTGKGFDGNLFVMQSNCGVDSLESVKKIPITMVEIRPGLRLLGARPNSAS